MPLLVKEAGRAVAKPLGHWVDARKVVGLILRPVDYSRLGESRSVNRDRGRLHSLPPPTPPGIRVRTTAIRLVKLWVQVDSIKLSLLVGLSVIEDAALGTVPA